MSRPALPPPPAADARPEAPPFAEAAGQVMVRQARAMFRGKRFIGAAILVALSPLLAVLIRSTDPVPLVRIVLNLQVAFLIPILAVGLGSGLLHEEAEEGTLTYLFTAPVAKSSIVLGKWAGALACGWGLSLASLGATFLLTNADLSQVGGFVGATFLAAVLGLPAYLGFFTFLGTLFRRGYIAGLMYCFGFELILFFVPGATKRLSLGWFLRSLLEPHVKEKTPFEGYFDTLPADSATTCIIVLAGVAILFVAATLLLVPRKEFRARNVQG